jgi:hypothetical protein
MLQQIVQQTVQFLDIHIQAENKTQRELPI